MIIRVSVVALIMEIVHLCKMIERRLEYITIVVTRVHIVYGSPLSLNEILLCGVSTQ